MDIDSNKSPNPNKREKRFFSNYFNDYQKRQLSHEQQFFKTKSILNSLMLTSIVAHFYLYGFAKLLEHDDSLLCFNLDCHTGAILRIHISKKSQLAYNKNVILSDQLRPVNHKRVNRL